MKNAMIGGGWGAFAGSVSGFTCQLGSGTLSPHVTLWIGVFFAGILNGVLGAVLPARTSSASLDKD